MLLLLLLMSAACAESAPLPYAIESGFLIFPAEDGKQPVPIAVKDGFAAKAQELAAENAYLGTPMNLPETLLPYVSDELTGGEELVEIYATEAVIVMHTRSATCCAGRSWTAGSMRCTAKSSGRISGCKRQTRREIWRKFSSRANTMLNTALR